MGSGNNGRKVDRKLGHPFPQALVLLTRPGTNPGLDSVRVSSAEHSCSHGVLEFKPSREGVLHQNR